jgi:hypothetical protein
VATRQRADFSERFRHPDLLRHQNDPAREAKLPIARLRTMIKIWTTISGRYQIGGHANCLLEKMKDAA